MYGIIDAAMPRADTLTPQTWIAAATEVLIDRGIDAVRVDVLAKALEVTRGSFYWHFKDREALLVAVLHAWRDGATEQVIERFEGQQADAQALVGELISLPFRGRAAQRAARVELAIRAWARRDAMARHAGHPKKYPESALTRAQLLRYGCIKFYASPCSAFDILETANPS